MKMKENELMELESNEFRFLFNSFTVGLKDLKELKGKIRVLDLLSPYRLKTLDNTARVRAKDALITNFEVIKGENTDIYFIRFKLSKKAIDFILRYFRGFDRTYRKYKVEFSKNERSLIWRLKNNEPLTFNNKDWTDEEYEKYENPIQHLPTEWDYKMMIKEEKKRNFLIRREIKKYRQEFKTLPKVEPQKQISKNTLKNLEIKQGGVVYNGFKEVKRIEEVKHLW